MAKIIQNGEIYTINDIQGTYDKLPVGVYNLHLTQKGFHLEKTADFTLPSKIYGDMSIIDRWLKTYHDKKRNLGIILQGLKGGGKTITAKLLAIKAGLPIINISQGYNGPDFAQFITNPCLGDCVIFLDEYEKVYKNGYNNSDDENDSLLSILDGPYQTHHLFIFTVNETTISRNLINRPSRIFYKKNYGGLTLSEIEEVVDDKLVNKNLKKDLLLTCSKLFQISYDVLVSIIEEVNRFNEPASKCIEYMNLTPENSTFTIYQYFDTIDDGIEKRFCDNYANIVYDDNGEMCLDVNFLYIIRRKGRTSDDWRRSEIRIPFSEMKRLTDRAFQYTDDICTYIIKENVSYSYTNGYQGYEEVKPTGKVSQPLVVYLDEEGNYINHTPFEYEKNNIVCNILNRYNPKLKMKGNNTNAKALYDPCDEDDCCCGG